MPRVRRPGRRRRRRCRAGAQAAVGGDDADEVAHRLAEALLLQHRERGARGLVHVDQRRFQQPAEIGAGVDQAAERLHLRHHGVERVLLLGVRVERGGVAVGKAAAGGDRRSARGHVAFPMFGPRASAGVNGGPARCHRRGASSMGSGGEQPAGKRNIPLGSLDRVAILRSGRFRLACRFLDKRTYPQPWQPNSNPPAAPTT